MPLPCRYHHAAGRRGLEPDPTAVGGGLARDAPGLFGASDPVERVPPVPGDTDLAIVPTSRLPVVDLKPGRFRVRRLEQLQGRHRRARPVSASRVRATGPDQLVERVRGNFHDGRHPPVMGHRIGALTEPIRRAFLAQRDERPAARAGGPPRRACCRNRPPARDPRRGPPRRDAAWSVNEAQLLQG